jgi:hypothetical protein
MRNIVGTVKGLDGALRMIPSRAENIFSQFHPVLASFTPSSSILAVVRASAFEQEHK